MILRLSLLLRAGDEIGLSIADRHSDRIEETRIARSESQSLQARRQNRGPMPDGSGYASQSLRAVIDRVHRRYDRKQHLRRADIGSRLLAPDVLLARLQRKAIRGRAARINRHTHQPAGQCALVRILHRDIGGVRPTISHRNAEPLHRADRDVRPELARRDQQGQCQRIGGHDCETARALHRADRGARVPDIAEGSRN